MKKKLFLMCLVGFLTVTSAYAKCDGGTEVKNSVGTVFCQSTKAMNWWSAAAWCKANELHLATVYEMCPSWGGRTTGADYCNEKGGLADFVWTATAHSTDEAVYVGSSGRIYGDHLRNSSGSKAVCISR